MIVLSLLLLLLQRDCFASEPNQVSENLRGSIIDSDFGTRLLSWTSYGSKSSSRYLSFQYFIDSKFEGTPDVTYGNLIGACIWTGTFAYMWKGVKSDCSDLMLDVYLDADCVKLSYSTPSNFNKDTVVSTDDNTYSGIYFKKITCDQSSVFEQINGTVSLKYYESEGIATCGGSSVVSYQTYSQNTCISSISDGSIDSIFAVNSEIKSAYFSADQNSVVLNEYLSNDCSGSVYGSTKFYENKCFTSVESTIDDPWSIVGEYTFGVSSKWSTFIDLKVDSLVIVEHIDRLNSISFFMTMCGFVVITAIYVIRKLKFLSN